MLLIIAFLQQSFTRHGKHVERRIGTAGACYAYRDGINCDLAILVVHLLPLVRKAALGEDAVDHGLRDAMIFEVKEAVEFTNGAQFQRQFFGGAILAGQKWR